jgi:ribose 5-phosphate isomerase B
MIYLGNDHRGYYLKEVIKKYLEAQKLQYEDLGNLEYDQNDDYPDFASLVAQKVSQNPKTSFGIIICGSGQGVNIVANKYPKIRAALCLSRWMAQKARQDDDSNVLSLAADLTDAQTALNIVKTFVTTKFSKKNRYQKRLQKITKIEKILYRKIK